MAVAIEVIPKAVFDWFNGNQAVGSVYAAVAGRIYYIGSTPTNAAWPFVTFGITPLSPTWAEAWNHEHMRLTFTGYCDDDPDCLDVDTLMRKLRTRFDFAVVTFDGSEYTTVECRPGGSSGGIIANPDETMRRSMRTQDYAWWLKQSA